VKRLFWLGVGIAVGVVVVRAVSRTAQAFTPSGIASGVQQSAGNVFDSIRAFVDDVREGMAEREAQIKDAFAEGVALSEDDLQGDDGLLGDGYRGGEGVHREYREGKHS
jgi:hypothetical protein